MPFSSYRRRHKSVFPTFSLSLHHLSEDVFVNTASLRPHVEKGALASQEKNKNGEVALWWWIPSPNLEIVLTYQVATLATLPWKTCCCCPWKLTFRSLNSLMTNLIHRFSYPEQNCTNWSNGYPTVGYEKRHANSLSWLWVEGVASLNEQG